MRAGKILFLLASGWWGCVLAQAASEPWLLIDTQSRTLKVLREAELLDVFESVAIGRNGAGLKLGQGDRTTPLGVFRVGWINARSRYDLFIGLDYPNLPYAMRGFFDSRIDRSDYILIRRAIQQRRTPPQNTPLGGFIGIHGVGEADPWVHANVDWTDGCVALSTRQIWRLAQWVQVGTRVEIR
jgi:murein L,D-transpeptidase YafK